MVLAAVALWSGAAKIHGNHRLDLDRLAHRVERRIARTLHGLNRNLRPVITLIADGISRLHLAVEPDPGLELNLLDFDCALSRKAWNRMVQSVTCNQLPGQPEKLGRWDSEKLSVQRDFLLLESIFVSSNRRFARLDQRFHTIEELDEHLFIARFRKHKVEGGPVD